MDVKILLVDDNEELCKQIQQLLNDENIADNTVKVEYKTDFDGACNALEETEYDIAVLDLFRGKPEEKNADRPGEAVLERIKKSCFIPVIFFTGLVKPVEHLKSDIVRVVRKGDSLDALKTEIQSVLESNLPLIRKKLNIYIRESLRSYFWDFVHPNWKMLEEIKDDVSLGYLIVRRLATSLSKEKIVNLLGDSKISADKVHPMEFYVYPPVTSEYETGDILEESKNIYVMLTPSCDFVLRDGKRRAEYALLACSLPLKETDEYKKYNENNKDRLTRLIEDRRGDRFFFLPKAPFIDNSVIDFQMVRLVSFTDLSKFKKIAKLDDPYAQAMSASFMRYYNRIGSPDIDSTHILDNL